MPALTACLTVLGLVAGPAWGLEGPSAEVFKERMAGTIPLEYADFGGVLFSPDGRRVGYSANEGVRWLLVLDGKRADRTAGVGGLSFSGIEWPFLFSPDGKHVAYRTSFAGSGMGKAAVAVDGKIVSALYDRLTIPAFSRDGKKVAYAGLDGKGYHVFVSGKGIGTFDNVLNLVFSPDGETVAFGAARDRKYFVFINGKKVSEGFSVTGGMAFSPDGKDLAYMAMDHLYQWFFIMGTKKVHAPEYQSGPLVFSPDGRHVAYIGSGKSQFILVDHERLGPGFRGVKPPVFDPGSRRVAYAASEMVPETGARVEKWFMVVDARKVSGDFDEVVTPVFSPDGRKVAFGARLGRQLWWKVVDASGSDRLAIERQALAAEKGARVRISSAAVAFLGDGGTVIKRIPLGPEERSVPTKDAPTKNYWSFDVVSSSDNFAPRLRVYADRKANADFGKKFVCLVTTEKLRYSAFGDFHSLGSDVSLLDAAGKELWRKRFDGFLVPPPRISSNGRVLLLHFRDSWRDFAVRAFDAAGREVFSFPPSERIKEFKNMEIKGTSPDHGFATAEMNNEHLTFLNIADNAYWETNKSYCKVHQMLDGGIARVSCPKSSRELGITEFFEADIQAHRLSPLKSL